MICDKSLLVDSFVVLYLEYKLIVNLLLVFQAIAPFLITLRKGKYDIDIAFPNRSKVIVVVRCVFCKDKYLIGFNTASVLIFCFIMANYNDIWSKPEETEPTPSVEYIPVKY